MNALAHTRSAGVHKLGEASGCIPKPDAIQCNTLINEYCMRRRLPEVEAAFDRMTRAGVKPDGDVYVMYVSKL